MSAERLARSIVALIAVVLPVAAVFAGKTGLAAGQPIEIHGTMSETGGWTPSDLTAAVGEPIRLRLTSDDVMHGFAIGQSDLPAVDVKPGEMTELTLTFEKPGKYTYYCTRWCGLNHWRMRGTIQVNGPDVESLAAKPPLYVTLGIDIDAPRTASVLPARAPSAARGSQLGVAIPAEYLSRDHYRAHSPVETWTAFRAASFTAGLGDGEVWDLVAFVWQSHTAPESFAEAARLFAENCAACHGERGAGDGVMAAELERQYSVSTHGTVSVADFTDPIRMMSASPALLQGKIVRGGMGTGMPYWGPIFSEAQTWTLVDYLYNFQYEEEQP